MVWCGVVWCSVVWCGVVMRSYSLSFFSRKEHFESHPNILELYGATTNQRDFYIVSEILPHGDLRKALMQGSINIHDRETLKKIILGIVQGMIHLHSKDIVHRDLAARNILLDEDNNPKICGRFYPT